MRGVRVTGESPGASLIASGRVPKTTSTRCNGWGGWRAAYLWRYVMRPLVKSYGDISSVTRSPASTPDAVAAKFYPPNAPELVFSWSNCTLNRPLGEFLHDGTRDFNAIFFTHCPPSGDYTRVYARAFASSRCNTCKMKQRRDGFTMLPNATRIRPHWIQNATIQAIRPRKTSERQLVPENHRSDGILPSQPP